MQHARNIILAKKYKLLVVEDCAESIGAKVGKNLLEPLEMLQLFFFANKLITTGEGGAII